MQLVIEPDERHQQGPSLIEVGQKVLISPICLADLSFHPISLDSPFKATFGDTDQDLFLCGGVTIAPIVKQIDKSYGERNQRMRSSFLKVKAAAALITRLRPDAPSMISEHPSLKGISPTEPQSPHSVRPHAPTSW